jgi:hypothetical protein
MHLLGLDREQPGQRRLHRVRRLHAEPVVQATVGVPHRRADATFERHGREPRHRDALPHHHLAVGEQVGEVVDLLADRELRRDVAADVGEQHDVAARSGLGAQHHR